MKPCLKNDPAKFFKKLAESIKSGKVRVVDFSFKVSLDHDSIICVEENGCLRKSVVENALHNLEISLVYTNKGGRKVRKVN